MQCARLSAAARRWASASAPTVLLDLPKTPIGVATLTLNRPAALNALTTEMVVRARRQLQEVYARRAVVRALVLRGAGGKAFCAGGDVKGLWEGRSGGAGGPQETFFREEYALDYSLALADAAIPHVALYDGVVMGGGAGVSIHSSFRVATERTVFAMPETAIGLFPDVGGSFFLPRLQHGLGMFMALTGHRLKGADCVHAGVATHYVPSANMAALEADLVESLQRPADNDNIAARRHDVAVVLSRHAVSTPDLPRFSLSPAEVASLTAAFAQPTVEGIVAALASASPDGSSGHGHKSHGSAAAAALLALRRASPTSLKVTHQQILRGASMSLKDCFGMELRLVMRFMQKTDFYEGVRALLVQKDNKPQWNPAKLEEVSPAEVASYFEPLRPGESAGGELRLPDTPLD